MKIVWVLVALFILANVVDVISAKRSIVSQSIFNIFLAPLNAAIHLSTPSWLRSKIAKSPILVPTTALFPSVDRLRNFFPTLEKEAQNAFEASKPIKNDLFFQGIADDGWKRFYLKWYGPTDTLGLETCPETCLLLASMPEVHLAMFSILMPKSKIQRHFGPAKMCLRYHLGISTPNDPKCRINIGHDTYFWKDGEDVMFDDTHVHEVTNNTDKPRIILFLDIERPQVGPLAFVGKAGIKYGGPLTTRSNETAIGL